MPFGELETRPVGRQIVIYIYKDKTYILNLQLYPFNQQAFKVLKGLAIFII